MSSERLLRLLVHNNAVKSKLVFGLARLLRHAVWLSCPVRNYTRRAATFTGASANPLAWVRPERPTTKSPARDGAKLGTSAAGDQICSLGHQR